MGWRDRLIRHGPRITLDCDRGERRYRAALEKLPIWKIKPESRPPAGPLAATRNVGRMDIQFIATLAVIAPDPQQSRELFIDALGLPLEASPDSDYFHSERIKGSKHFAIWPLSEAAEACFGTPDWPADRTVPQMSLEFEVHDADAVQSAAEELRERGFAVLHERREEPWGQTVARLQSAEGSIIGISFTPGLRS